MSRSQGTILALTAAALTCFAVGCDAPIDDGEFATDLDDAEDETRGDADGGESGDTSAPSVDDLPLDPGIVLGRTIVVGPDGPFELTYENRDGIAFVGGDVELGPVDELPLPEDVDLEALSDLSIGDEDVTHGFTPVPLWGQAWPNGVVYYVAPDTGWDDLDERVDEAIETIEQLTNFDFVPIPESLSPYLSHIYFTTSFYLASGGSSDSVGRKGGRQYLRFSAYDQLIDDPPSERLVLHELGHALGLYHEHQRPDRDDYVLYLPFCVEQGQGHNFDKYVGFMWGPYDVSSVMHYRAGSLDNGVCNPLTSLTGATLGGDTLSSGDIAALNWAANF